MHVQCVKTKQGTHAKAMHFSFTQSLTSDGTVRYSLEGEDMTVDRAVNMTTSPASKTVPRNK